MNSTEKNEGKPVGKIVARAKGWFSARHETDTAHKSAQEAYQTRRLIKKNGACHREELAKARSPREQLAILDQRLGVNVGAKKERAKLLAAIQAEFEPVGEFQDPGPSHNTEERNPSEFFDDRYESDERVDSSYYLG